MSSCFRENPPPRAILIGAGQTSGVSVHRPAGPSPSLSVRLKPEPTSPIALKANVEACCERLAVDRMKNVWSSEPSSKCSAQSVKHTSQHKERDKRNERKKKCFLQSASFLQNSSHSWKHVVTPYVQPKYVELR